MRKVKRKLILVLLNRSWNLIGSLFLLSLFSIRNDEDDKNSPSIICLNATKKVSVTSTINKANVLSKPLYISGY